MAAVHIGQRVDLRAAIEQRPRELDRIGRRLLAVTLDAIGRNVVEQRGTMHRGIEAADARRSSAHEFRMRAQRFFNGRQISRNHAFHRGFEHEDRAALTDRSNIGFQRGPIGEVMETGNGEPRVIERQGRLADFRVRNALRQPRNGFIEEAGMLAMEEVDGLRVGCTVGGQQVRGLPLVDTER